MRSLPIGALLGAAAIDVGVRPSDAPCVFEVVADGRTVRTEAGTSIHVDPRAAGRGYVRVRVTDASGRRAWTQPALLGRGRRIDAVNGSIQNIDW